MPSIPLYPPTPSSDPITLDKPNPLPPLLRTPSGLALLEIQGTIQSSLPLSLSISDPSNTSAHEDQHGGIAVGELVFPLYNETGDAEDATWRKKVYLYVGGRQRLTGEVKELRRPIAVVRRRKKQEEGGVGAGHEEGEELEIMEVVRYKVLFAQRPEPV